MFASQRQGQSQSITHPMARPQVGQDIQTQTPLGQGTQARLTQTTTSRSWPRRSSSTRTGPSSTSPAPHPLATRRRHHHEFLYMKPERPSQTNALAEEDNIIPALDDYGFASIRSSLLDQYGKPRSSHGVQDASSRRSARLFYQSVEAGSRAFVNSPPSRYA